MSNKKLSATPDEALYVLSMTQIQYYVDYIRKMDDEFKKDPKFYSLEKLEERQQIIENIHYCQTRISEILNNTTKE